MVAVSNNFSYSLIQAFHMQDKVNHFYSPLGHSGSIIWESDGEIQRVEQSQNSNYKTSSGKMHKQCFTHHYDALFGGIKEKSHIIYTKKSPAKPAITKCV